jgi:hypothetical protein
VAVPDTSPTVVVDAVEQQEQQGGSAAATSSEEQQTDDKAAVAEQQQQQQQQHQQEEPEVAVAAAVAVAPTTTLGSSSSGAASTSSVLSSERGMVQAMRSDASRLAEDMKRDLELSLLRGTASASGSGSGSALHQQLDEQGVQNVLQLASEQFERVSYEIIVLQQSLHTVEGEVEARYRELMRQQHNGLEEQLRQQLHSQENVQITAMASKLQDATDHYRAQLEQAVHAKQTEFEASVAAARAEEREQVLGELQEEMFRSLAKVEEKSNAQLLDVQSSVEETASRVAAFNNVLDQNEGVMKRTLATHTISGALLALEMALGEASSDSGHSIKAVATRSAVHALRTMCEDDRLIVSVLDSLPARVVQAGAPSLSELQVRFHVMRNEVRKAALAPEHAPQMVGQVIGTVMASIASAPKGYVRGEGVEERLARAAFELERGRLKQAVRELEGVEGYTAVLMGDWKQLAEDRLLVEQSLQSLKARAVVLHRAFSS